MKNKLIINPSDQFINKNDDFENIFVDRFIYDQCKVKKSTDKYFSSRLDYSYRIENFNLSNQLFYEILECIKLELNSIFKKNLNQKFFEIVIGAWLRKFIQQFILKYKNIIESKKKFNINYATIYDTTNFNFFTTETHTIQHATINNLWNTCIYSYILNNCFLDIKLNILKLSEKKFDDTELLSNRKSSDNKKNFKQNIINIWVYLTNLIPNNSNIFLYNMGFEFFNEKKIDLSFGQLPRVYPLSFNFNYSNFDCKLRKNLNFEKFVKLSNQNYDKHFVKIFNLIIRILNKSLPITIVEDFKNLIEYSEKLNFPKNPKAICTSYAFESIEPFKYYVALRKFYNPKIKYFVYQHGGSYITRLDNSYNNECNTCDYFITWGDKTDTTKKNNLKFVNFKLLNKKYFKNKKVDKFLILMRSSGYNAVPYDRYSEGLNQLDLTVKLCKKFSSDLVKKTVIRAHYASKNRIEDQLKDLDRFKIDYSEQNYFDIINSAKLILFNHDSTGILEMFALNKPTLCLWERGYQHQNKFVVQDYELLKNSKIFFDDQEKLYQHLLDIWNDPLKWWNNDNVQNNLKKFVNLYTQLPDKNFNLKFKRIIKNKL